MLCSISEIFFQGKIGERARIGDFLLFEWQAGIGHSCVLKREQPCQPAGIYFIFLDFLVSCG